ncbi:hypothetical protein [Burkholderia multivorans]|uniref:hypothetical protein n=1 Tax=Burkholderia multivorans TaxID=87883 RepID=UPI001E2E6F3D|nr:hypothetical protein [Burkholderia multivorans]
MRVVTVKTFGFDVAATSEAVEQAASTLAAAATVNPRRIRKEAGLDMGKGQARVASTAFGNMGDSMPARSPEIMPFSVNTLFRMVKRSRFTPQYLRFVAHRASFCPTDRTRAAPACAPSRR